MTVFVANVRKPRPDGAPVAAWVEARSAYDAKRYVIDKLEGDGYYVDDLSPDDIVVHRGFSHILFAKHSGQGESVPRPVSEMPPVPPMEDNGEWSRP